MSGAYNYCIGSVHQYGLSPYNKPSENYTLFHAPAVSMCLRNSLLSVVYTIIFVISI